MYRQAAVQANAPSPLFLRAVIGGTEPSSGLSIAPDIPPKKLQGALTFAQVAPGEVPLLLVDSSVMLSGKAGMLLTDRAAYFDAPRARVPIEAITHPPVAGKPATLPTPMGVVTLPSMVDDCAVAMLRALRAVAFFNRGAARHPFGHAAVPGPVGDAAMALRHPDLAVAPMLPARAVHAGSNVAHAWLDHDAGEELLCFLDEAVGRDGSRGIALTDRRIIAYGDSPIDVPYGSLTGVSLKTGMLTQSILLMTPMGAAKVDSIAPEAVVRTVTDFLVRLGSIPPPQRQSWPGPAPGPDDPSGAMAAMASIPWPDLRVAALLELVHAATARGAVPPESARDLVARALRLQRTLRGGHGRSGAMQRSPLSAADLEATLVQLLGAPSWYGFDGGWRTVDFDLSRAGSGLGAVASSAVGLTLLAVVGVGWVSFGSGTQVQRIRARIAEGPGGAGFALQDPQGAPLARGAAKLAGGVLESLADASASVLLRRVLCGWEAPLDALLREPPASLDQRARALVPHTDIAPFFAG